MDATHVVGLPVSDEELFDRSRPRVCQNAEVA